MLLGKVKDAKQYEAKFLADNKIRLLDGVSISGDRTAYMTYMRSGNTFLRKYLELITGVATGADVLPVGPIDLIM